MNTSESLGLSGVDTHAIGPLGQAWRAEFRVIGSDDIAKHDAAGRSRRSLGLWSSGYRLSDQSNSAPATIHALIRSVCFLLSSWPSAGMRSASPGGLVVRIHIGL